MRRVVVWTIVTPRGTDAVLAVVSLFASRGCAAVGLTLLAVGAGTPPGLVSRTPSKGIAYKTFTVPLEGLHRATLITLKRMDITVTGSRDTEAGRKIQVFIQALIEEELDGCGFW